jgi:MFS family permease
LRALDGVNFFVAGVLAGFGPFVAFFLGAQGWSQERIGLVLSVGGIAGLLAQLPGGELLDVVQSKRLLVAAGSVMVGLGALIIAFRPEFVPVSLALMLQGTTSGFLGPGIASISLGLVGHRLLGERLGRNQRFKSTGSLAAAGLFGFLGYFLSKPRYLTHNRRTRAAGAGGSGPHPRQRYSLWTLMRRTQSPRCHPASSSPSLGTLEEPLPADLCGLLVPVSDRRCCDIATDWRNSCP